MTNTPKPRAWLDDDQPFLPSLTVYEGGSDLVDTGLFNADGTKIFRRAQLAIGFDLSRGRL